MSKHQEYTGWALLAGFAALLAYLVKNASSLLHESVTAGIVTSQNTTTADPLTGAPQYDTRVGATIPEQEAFAIPPIGRTCPEGYTLWRNAADGSYHCLPDANYKGFVQ